MSKPKHTNLHYINFSLFLIFFTAYGSISFAQTAQEIITKHLQAIGGPTKIAAINTYSFEYGSSTVYYKKPNKWRIEDRKEGKITSTQIYLGGNGWITARGEGAVPASSNMSFKEFIPDILTYVTKINYKIEALGKDDASDNLLLKISPLINNVLETNYMYYINPSTYMVTKMINNLGGKSYNIYFEDYTTINGLKIPLKITQVDDIDSKSKEKYSDVITNIKFNIPLDDKLFLKPALKKVLEGYKDANGKWGYRDENFITVIKPKYDATWEFEEGVAKVSLNNLYGLINATGKEVVPLKYTSISSFAEGLVAVEMNKKFGFLNASGKEAIPLQYTNAGDFKEGFASVEINNKWGCINKSGKLIIDAKYDRVKGFDKGIAIVKLGKKYGCIDTKGVEVIPVIYDNMGSFKDGRLAVKKDNESYFIDKDGKRIN